MLSEMWEATRRLLDARSRTALLTAIALLTGGCRAGRTDHPAHPGPAHAARPSAGSRALQLTDVTAASGVRFRHHTGAFGRKWFPETNGSGAAVFDYDNDGWPDLFLINSRSWSSTERKAARLPPGSPPPATPSRLYRNRGDGTFIDATHASGLDVPMYGMGCAVGDYDNDGFTDLYITGVGRGWLFRNESGRRFQEVSGPAGVQGSGWSTGCAWVDIDRDRDLDLFVCHYVKWDPRTDTPCEGRDGVSVYCGPNLYAPEACRLYRNQGNGTFQEVSREARIWGRKGAALRSKALGVAICDVDRDGWPDLAVANDTEMNFLFRNNRDGTFTEEGLATGVALPERGEARSGMGIDAADWDGAGRESLLIGNFPGELLALYRPDENGLFADTAAAEGLAEPSRPFTTFGCLFLDLNSDGWLDVAAANGHIDAHTAQDTPVPHAQRPLFLLNQEGQRFHEERLYLLPLVGRGLAAGDWDRDGAVDLVITTNGGAPVLLRNGGGQGNSVRVLLEGTRSNRSGIGTEIVARVGGHEQRRRVRGSSGYLSASELAVTLGLGTAASAEQVVVRWPNGAVEPIGTLAAGKEYRMREGEGVVAAADRPTPR
jgi:enediyne biosynthesis protein E4